MRAAREKNGVYIPHERFVQDEAEKKVFFFQKRNDNLLLCFFNIWIIGYAVPWLLVILNAHFVAQAMSEKIEHLESDLECKRKVQFCSTVQSDLHVLLFYGPFCSSMTAS